MNNFFFFNLESTDLAVKDDSLGLAQDLGPATTAGCLIQTFGVTES